MARLASWPADPKASYETMIRLTAVLALCLQKLFLHNKEQRVYSEQSEAILTLREECTAFKQKLMARSHHFEMLNGEPVITYEPALLRQITEEFLQRVAYERQQLITNADSLKRAVAIIKQEAADLRKEKADTLAGLHFLARKIKYSAHIMNAFKKTLPLLAFEPSRRDFEFKKLEKLVKFNGFEADQRRGILRALREEEEAQAHSLRAQREQILVRKQGLC